MKARLITLPSATTASAPAGRSTDAACRTVSSRCRGSTCARSVAPSGRRTTPVLVASGASLLDSADIVRYADANALPGRTLYPAPHAALPFGSSAR